MIASFIIIEYHSINDIEKCINSIDALNLNFEHEIIISSNSQYDNHKQRELLIKFPKIIWSFNTKNNGFAYGMNRGIAKSKGDFVILQNPDTRIISGDFIEMFNFIRKNNVGVLGPKIINNDMVVQDSCRSFLTPVRLLKRLFFRYFFKKQNILYKKFDYKKIQKVDWVIGGFMVIPKSTINQIEGLNEKYFMYVEDMAYCLSAWENNLKVVYYPEILICYEGDRKSAGSSIFSLNNYTKIHIKNYCDFLKNYYNSKFKSINKTDFNHYY